MQKDEFFATETPREATVTELMSWVLGKELLHETNIRGFPNMVVPNNHGFSY